MSPIAHTLEDSFVLTCPTEPGLLSASSSSSSLLSSHSSASGQLGLGNMMSTPNWSRGRTSPTGSAGEDGNVQPSASQETSAIADLSTIRASFTQLRKELDVRQSLDVPDTVCQIGLTNADEGAPLTKAASSNASKRTRDKSSAYGQTTTAATSESLDRPATSKSDRETLSIPRTALAARPFHPSINTQQHPNKNVKITVPKPFAFTTSTSLTDTASVIPSRKRCCSNPTAPPISSASSRPGSRSGLTRSASRGAIFPQKRERQPEERCISPRVGYMPSFREIHLQDEARQARRTERIRSERTEDKERDERRLGRRVEQRGKERARWEKERRERELERERGREEEQKREQECEELQILQERKATVIKANPIPDMYSSTLPHASSTRPRTRAQTYTRTQ